MIVRGDARRLPLADGSVSCVITSPPYFALRSYRDSVFAESCDRCDLLEEDPAEYWGDAWFDHRLAHHATESAHFEAQIGSEPTPAAFVEALLVCAEEWRRVLRSDGCVWVNLDDKYAGGGGGNYGTGLSNSVGGTHPTNVSNRREWLDAAGVRPKSMMGLPWRFAIAMIDNGWILRRDVIWSKPNGLPESVTDRPRRSHETWFMFTKEPRYFSALDELREPQASLGKGRPWSTDVEGSVPTWGVEQGSQGLKGRRTTDQMNALNPLGRLPGSVRTVPTEPLSPGPVYDCDETYGSGKDIGGYDAPWPMPDHRIMHAKDLWPWLWHLVGQGLESYVVGPHVDHFAAFPQAWPEWIITGWVPLRGICEECDEGLRPVVDVDWSKVPHSLKPGRSTNPTPEQAARWCAEFADWCETEGVTRRMLDDACGTSDMGGWWASRLPHRSQVPTPEQWAKIRNRYDPPAALDALVGETVMVPVAEWETPDTEQAGRHRTTKPATLSRSDYTTITGYACPCGPEGTTPTRKPLVCDPFGGTGTVAGVARKLGANAISVDLSHDYGRLAAYLLTTARFGKSVRRRWERRQGSLL